MYIHYAQYSLINNSIAIIFFYGMSSARAGLVHIVTSLKHRYFLPNLLYIIDDMEVVSFV